MGYLGSKAASGAYQAIIATMPPHDIYIETHIGSGAVMLRKPPARKNIGIDIDKQAIELCSRALKHSHYCGDIVLVNQDAHEFLADYTFSGNELIYVDPPYLLNTRSSGQRYRHEYNDADHIKLLRLLKTLDCSVLISGYPSALYDDCLINWNTKTFQCMTRGGIRTEKLWFNYQLNAAYWAAFAGDNFTERQRIKRKAERWAKNYEKLPAPERIAILAAILNIESYTL